MHDSVWKVSNNLPRKSLAPEQWGYWLTMSNKVKRSAGQKEGQECKRWHHKQDGSFLWYENGDTREKVG